MHSLLETGRHLPEVQLPPRAKRIALIIMGALLAVETFLAFTAPAEYALLRTCCVLILLALTLSISSKALPTAYVFCFLTLTAYTLYNQVSELFFLLGMFGFPLAVLLASSRQVLALAISLCIALSNGFMVGSLVYTIIVAISLFFIFFGLPFSLRLAWEQKTASDRKYKQLQEQVAEANRALARELHDTIARQISIIGLSTNQALNAPTLDAKDTALTTIQEKTHRALADMRLLIQATRADHSITALPEVSPVTINLEESINQAIARLTSKGFTVDAHIDLASTEIPEGVRPTLHKVIEEIRFNAEKYAAPGSTIKVTARPNLTGITIATSNPLPAITGKKKRSPSTGYGLVGIQERIRRLGGTINYGVEGQTWRLTINLPLVTD